MRIKDVKKRVLVILETKPQTRNSDNDLYYEMVREIVGPRKLSQMTAKDLLLKRKDYGLPTTESVRRARQKCQAEYPALSAVPRVTGFRVENELEYREFAKRRR